MRNEHPWNIAKQIDIKIDCNITGNFDIGFDDKIPDTTKKELQNFVLWVEANFSIPVTLWVDFEYKHYLVNKEKERVGYVFYWADFLSYPVFKNKDDIPTIRLPVRTEHYTMEEILTSFIEAISCYFAWIRNILHDNYQVEKSDVEDVLQEYLNSKQHENPKQRLL